MPAVLEVEEPLDPSVNKHRLVWTLQIQVKFLQNEFTICSLIFGMTHNSETRSTTCHMKFDLNFVRAPLTFF